MTDQVKKFKVYHSTNWALNTKLHFDTDGYAPVKSNYELVATVHCLDINQASMFTNHIDKAWFDHLNVDVVKESRSTSVGDLVEDEDGILWLCDAWVGWKEVKWNENDDFVVYTDDYGSYLVSKKDLIEEVRDGATSCFNNVDKLLKAEKAIKELLV
jgi:hypothetical protein